MTLVSEHVGQFFHEGHRLEYTEYGAGDRWVVLLHGQLMPRRMHQPLARHLAGQGAHVLALDLLGHGRSDRPDDPLVYSMTAFGEQVIALLDELGIDRAVVGGTSLGANVSLEVATLAPERVQGVLAEMPVLDNALEAGILAFAPLLFASRFLPLSVTGLRLATRAVPRAVVPFWTGIVLDTLDQRPAPMAATIHGIFFGRVAPSSRLRRRDPGARAGRRAPARPRAPRGRRRDAGRGDAPGTVRGGPRHPRVAAAPAAAARPGSGVRRAVLRGAGLGAPPPGVGARPRLLPGPSGSWISTRAGPDPG